MYFENVPRKNDVILPGAPGEILSPPIQEGFTFSLDALALETKWHHHQRSNRQNNAQEQPHHFLN
jgi:hypothetical protein